MLTCSSVENYIFFINALSQMGTNIQRYLNIIFIDFFFNCKDKYDHGDFDFSLCNTLTQLTSTRHRVVEVYTHSSD